MVNADDVRMLWAYCRGKWNGFAVPADERARNAMSLAWLDDLADLDRETCRTAITAIARKSTFPASPGEIRDKALELIAIAAGIQPPPDSERAWAEVMDGVRRHGRRQKPDFTHPVLAEFVQGFGWSRICSSENIDVLRGQFTRLYEQARQRAIEAIRPPAPAIAAFLDQHRALPPGDAPNGLVGLPMERHGQG